MKRYLSNQITPEMNNEEIEFCGWVHETRDFGGLKFLILKDRFGMVQVTMHKSMVTKELMDMFPEFTKESCIGLTGKIQKAEKAQKGFEIIPTKIDILSKADTPTPIDTSGKIESDLSTRFDYRFLDLRDPKNQAIFRVRAKIFLHTAEFFDSQGFTCIQTPKLTSAGVESGAEMFEVRYFDKTAYLSQSPQIYKQMMVTAGFEKVYDLGTVFRAESSHTTRHLTEFTGIDFEMGFIKDENDIMDVIENYLKYLTTKLNETCKEELETYGVTLKVPEKIPRIDINEIRKVLEEKGKIVPEDDDLDPEAEQMTSDYVKEKYGEDFVFVTNFPWEKRPFYHMKPLGDSKGTRSFDLLWSGLEVATGAQREHRYDVLLKQAKQKNVNLEEMETYSMLFKYGSPPHGGVGMGLDRFTQKLLGLENVKEAILLPRDPTRLTP